MATMSCSSTAMVESPRRMKKKERMSTTYPHMMTTRCTRTKEKISTSPMKITLRATVRMNWDTRTKTMLGLATSRAVSTMTINLLMMISQAVSIQLVDLAPTKRGMPCTDMVLSFLSMKIVKC